MRRILLLLVCLPFLSIELEAKHIIGGEITYECLGEDRYRFSMRIYRDDSCTDCAPFDDPAQIAVYKCPAQNCSPNDSVIEGEVPIERISQVAPPDLPCLQIPENIRVQEGLYIFDLTLPSSPESYHVVYQRCCRNVTINNIINPDDSGATYTVEITPEAQQVCNNSPVFRQFPPIVICADEALNFDHSAVDMDGDSLVYEFCAPLLGGGTDGSTTPGSPTSCTGVTPTPPCPPSFSPVVFITPPYTVNRPMAGNPIVRIDRQTGIITGTPREQGQFVVGVCVKEYRDGVLIGEIKRDFQFNVTSCQPLVEAIIPADSVINGREFLINSCGNATIDFGNNSTDPRFIDTYQWNFGINGEDTFFDERTPTVSFPGVGQYAGQLVLNPNTVCSDTANITVNVYPAIFADFAFDYDTCYASPVEFTNFSYTEADNLTNIAWDFDDGNRSTTFEPTHLYDEPALWNVNLTVRDVNECEASITKPVPYFPIPPTIIVAPDLQLGCAPQFVLFNNLSSPISEEYDILWDFGDGNTATTVSPNHVYETPGTYTVSLDIVSPLGCAIDTVYEDLITVEPSPIADFTYTPDVLSVIDPTASFFEQAQEAIRWVWTFNNRVITFEENPTHTFIDTGLQRVQLVVEHESGCLDTLVQFIDVIPEVRYFLPNAFTPNGDGKNDGFVGKGLVRGMEDFEMTIWNRWGELVFQSNNPRLAWNGQKQNTGMPAPNGVYVAVARFRNPRGEREEYQTFVTLIR